MTTTNNVTQKEINWTIDSEKAKYTLIKCIVWSALAGAGAGFFGGMVLSGCNLLAGMAGAVLGGIGGALLGAAAEATKIAIEALAIKIADTLWPEG